MLKKAVAFSLVTYFLHVTTWEGHIFHRPANWLREKLPESLQKPLFDCPICMTPYYGTIMLLLQKGKHKELVKDILTVGAAAGLSSLLVIASKLHGVLNLMEEKYEEGTTEDKG